MAETLSQRAARFQRLGLALLPPGIAWARYAGSAMASVMGAFLYEYARVEESADTFLTEMDPTQTTALLSEWETALGLPDDCGTPTTTAGRRAAIVARVAGGGTNTYAEIEAAVTRFDAQSTLVSITGYTPFAAGVGVAGGALYGDEYAATFLVTISTANASLDQSGLECLIDQYKRAHTHYLYAYQAPALLTEGGDTLITEAGDTLVTE